MRNLHTFYISLICLFACSCYKGKSVDLIVHNAVIHVMDEALHTAEAMAIKNGKIVEVGPERQILNKYVAFDEVDAHGKPIYPGFINCHLDIHAAIVALKNTAIHQRMEITQPIPVKAFIKAVREMEFELYQYGVTGVHIAGATYSDIALFKKLINRYHFQLNTYLLLEPSNETLNFARRHGIYRYRNLSIRSFYAKNDSNYRQPTSLKKVAELCEKYNYQLCFNATFQPVSFIGLFEHIYETNKDHRWRIEYAHLIPPRQVKLAAQKGAFPCIIPLTNESQQSNSQTSTSFLYRNWLTNSGMFILGGTPAVSLDPFQSITELERHRSKTNSSFTDNTFNEVLTLSECLKGLTNRAALASFQENEIGTLEKGKDATFAVFEREMTPSKHYMPNFSLLTVIKGKKVYEAGSI